MKTSISILPTPYVIDASVAVKWFSQIDEESLENASKLQELHLNKECLLTCPYLLIYEVINALRYNPNFKHSDTEQALESLQKMELNFLELEEKELKEALKLGYQNDLTIYDASYLALAKSRQTFLITADRKFYQKAKDFHRVRFLADLES